MKLKFRYSLENFRGVAIIFVMLGHMSSFMDMGTTGNYFHFFFVDATAWFIFISGYLFFYLEIDRFKYGNYLYKKIKYVIFPYLLLSIPAILLGLYYSRNIMHDLTPGMYALWSLFVGGIVVAPMWFIPMIAIFFLLTPVFNVISRTKLILFVTIVSLFFGIFSFRSIYNTNPFFSFLHFSGFYFLGMATAKYTSSLDAMSNSFKTIIILVSFSVFLLVGVFYPGMENEPMGFLGAYGELNYIILGKLALLIFIFFIFEKFFNVKNVFLGFLAKISFGLFFIHGFMMLFFSKFLYGFFYPNSFIKFLCEIVVVIFFSIAVVVLLKRVFGRWSRYVIGC
ncbi:MULTISPECIES: acyltransferase [unclassified Janthinobacterium]|uniref:acyltransferase family protein n=1 Tax=unclassified Janthinobacterium TaxID=2610881 RepID=UPI0016209198|nr:MULTISPECIES: acyltransferase [unclassified Janthinobacterium]MBB5607356.1 peptidoglycan/LPS O-acetylase OafA/YrhL [Janthinobacterium sp. S3T4]MBB5612377.1 peptidoglycan/LPS O-acetylase OafA/YrhL [Janthinobacterium sp. S3M3]